MTSPLRGHPAFRRHRVLRSIVGSASLLALFATSWAVARSLARPQPEVGMAHRSMGGPLAPAADAPAPGRVRFTSWDLTLDPSGPLAAWQIELASMLDHSLGPSDRPEPIVVGIEGGDGAFAEPAHYDPAALGAGRLVMGAFSLDPPDDLPRQAFRAATVHVREAGGTDPAADSLPLRVRVEVAAGPDGSPITVEAMLVPARPRTHSHPTSTSPPQP